MFCLSMFDLLGLDSLPSAVLCSRARKNNPIGIISTLAAGSIRGFCNDAKLKAPSRRNRQPKETETRDEVQQHSRRIGHTPLVRLNRITKDLKPRIYVKAEF